MDLVQAVAYFGSLIWMLQAMSVVSYFDLLFCEDRTHITLNKVFCV